MPEPILDPAYWRDRIAVARDVNEPHQAVWNTGAEEFARVAGEHRGVIRRLVDPDDSVLDVGCGPGRLLDLLPQPFKGDYLGLDLSPDFVRAARAAFPGRAFLVTDVTRFPVPLRADGRRWDWAVLIGVESMFKKHLGPASWPPVLEKLRRAAKKLLVLDFTRGWRAEALEDEFKTYQYEGRITFAGPGERVRITVECERGAGPINERSPAETVHSVMDVITREVLAPEVTQEVRFDGAEWLPRETSAATPAGGDK